MAAFWQILAGVLLAVVLGITLSKQSRDMSVLLALAVCVMVILVAAVYLEPVIHFIRSLQSVGQLDSDMVSIMLKAVGISLVAQIAGMICSDAGFGSLGKAIKILATAAVLWLALPMMQSLLSMLQKMVGAV